LLDIFAVNLRIWLDPVVEVVFGAEEVPPAAEGEVFVDEEDGEEQEVEAVHVAAQDHQEDVEGEVPDLTAKDWRKMTSEYRDLVSLESKLTCSGLNRKPVLMPNLGMELMMFLRRIWRGLMTTMMMTRVLTPTRVS
jgi:hypothetical protein